MDLSLFMNPIHPLDRDYSETLREDQETVILADQLGFKDAFIGEHVTDAAENITNSALFLSSLASVTKRIRLSTGTSNLPQGHPALLAGQIAMLDHLCGGRFNFGISPGILASDSEALEIPHDERGAMFLECIDHILALWAGDPPYDLDGKYWRVSTAKTRNPEIGTGYIQKPYQKPHPPIFGTVIDPNSKGLVALAARGWKAVSSNFLPPRWLKRHYPLFAEGRAKGGLEADPADWYVARSICVAEDEKVAEHYAREADDSPYRFYYNQIATKLLGGGWSHIYATDDTAPPPGVTGDIMVEQVLITGTPESVTRQILELREEVGDFGTLVYVGHDWVNPGLARRSMELMAGQVMKAVNSAIGRTG